MKKIAVFMWMIVMMLSLAGCQKDEKEELDSRDLVYNYEILPCVNDIEGVISRFEVTEDMIYIHATKWADEQVTEDYFYKCDRDGGNLERILYKPKVTGDEWINAMEVSEQGELLLLYCCYSEETVGNTYVLRTVSPEGELLSETDFRDVLNVDDLFIQDMKKDKNGNLYVLSDQKIYIFGTSGEMVEQLEDEGLMTNIIRTKDGEILVGFDYQGGYTLKKIDADDLVFCETYDTSISYYTMTGCLDGLEYDFYYTDSESLYGYNLEAEEPVKKADWISSNLNSNFLGDVQMLTEDIMLATYGRDGSDDVYGLYFFKKADPKDVKEKEIVTYCSLFPDEEARECAIRFNRSQDVYQVVVRDYAGYEDPTEAMHKDLVAGQTADIVDLSGLSSDKYAARGIFVDLYEFMEADEEISKEDFQENVLSVMETDGKLYRIAPTVGINALVTHASALKNEESLSVRAMKEMEKGGAKAFYRDTKQAVLGRALEMNYEEYVDWSKGVCHFDEESFLSVLEYANTYVSDEEFVWEEDMKTMTDSVRDGEVLFASVYNLSMEDLQLYEKMFETDISVIGFPSEVFSGSALSMEREFAVSMSSNQKEGAWEFLKTYLSREYVSSQLAEGDILGIPIRKDSMEDKMKRITATEPYTDDFGHEIKPISYEWGYEDVFLQVGPLEDKLEELYRKTAKQADRRYVYDSDVMKMVQEEAKDYFDGEMSVKEAAENIQKRVSVYMDDYK